MKLKDGFIIRKVGKQYVAAATGEASKQFHGMIRLDESGAYAFELLRQDTTEEEMLAALAERYAIDAESLGESLTRFLGKLREAEAFV